MGHGAGKAWQREQVGAGEGRAEWHGAGVFQRSQHRKHQLANIHLGGLRRLLAGFGFGQRMPRQFSNEIAGARPGLNQATVFQQVIGLEHRGRADPVSAAGVAHRGYFLARGEHASADQFGNLVGKFLVAFHRVRRCAQQISALYGELPCHATVSAHVAREKCSGFAPAHWHRPGYGSQTSPASCWRWPFRSPAPG